VGLFCLGAERLIFIRAPRPAVHYNPRQKKARDFHCHQGYLGGLIFKIRLRKENRKRNTLKEQRSINKKLT
jgi:hypothetical protein